MINIKRSIFIILFISSIFGSGISYSQPYFDVGGITGWYLPKSKTEQVPIENYGVAFVSIPINISTGSKLVFSPFQENRYLKYEEIDDRLTLRGTALPITFLHTVKDSSWTFTATFIPRFNSEDFNFGSDYFQAGGAFINVLRIKPNLKIRFGLYYNYECFGSYIVPLAGIDWKINDRLQLFGILPNIMKLEYKFSKSIYSGLAFRSVENTYRAADGKGYYKIEDNHLCLFTDFYFTKNIVMMAEAGHTILRKFHNRSESQFPDFEKDGPVLKVGFYYRIRFENR